MSDDKRFECRETDAGLRFVCTRCGNAYKWKKSVNKHWKEKHESPDERINDQRFVEKVSTNLKQLHMLSSLATGTSNCFSASSSAAATNAVDSNNNPTIVAGGNSSNSSEISQQLLNAIEILKRSALAQQQPVKSGIDQPATLTGQSGIQSRPLSVATRQKTVNCAACPKTFNDMNELNEHFLVQHPEKLASEFTPEDLESGKESEKLLSCGLCSFKTTFAVSLQQHMNMHKDIHKKPFTCMVCQQSYRWRWDLMRHFSKSHSLIPNPYRKREPYSVFSSTSVDQPGTASSFITAHGTPVASYSSNTIHEQADNGNVSSLKMARRSDLSETAIGCDYPSNSTSPDGGCSSSNESRMNGPSGSKFKCSHCDYWARWPSEIAQHMKNHSNLRPYCCPRCHYRSKWKWDVVKHMKRCGDGSGSVRDVIDIANQPSNQHHEELWRICDETEQDDSDDTVEGPATNNENEVKRHNSPQTLYPMLFGGCLPEKTMNLETLNEVQQQAHPKQLHQLASFALSTLADSNRQQDAFAKDQQQRVQPKTTVTPFCSSDRARVLDALRARCSGSQKSATIFDEVKMKRDDDLVAVAENSSDQPLDLSLKRRISDDTNSDSVDEAPLTNDMAAVNRPGNIELPSGSNDTSGTTKNVNLPADLASYKDKLNSMRKAYEDLVNEPVAQTLHSTNAWLASLRIPNSTKDSPTSVERSSESPSLSGPIPTANQGRSPSAETRFSMDDDMTTPATLQCLSEGLNCMECLNICTTEEEVREHSRLHSLEKPFACDNCQYKTKWKCDLKKHCRAYAHNPVVPFEYGRLQFIEKVSKKPLRWFMPGNHRPRSATAESDGASSNKSASVPQLNTFIEELARDRPPINSTDTVTVSDGPTSAGRTVDMYFCKQCGFPADGKAALRKHKCQRSTFSAAPLMAKAPVKATPIDSVNLPKLDNVGTKKRRLFKLRRDGQYRCSFCSFHCMQRQRYLNHVKCHTIYGHLKCWKVLSITCWFCNWRNNRVLPIKRHMSITHPGQFLRMRQDLPSTERAFQCRSTIPALGEGHLGLNGSRIVDRLPEYSGYSLRCAIRRCLFRLRCPLCKLRPRSSADLINHCRAIHAAADGRFRCSSHCSFHTDSAIQLLRHREKNRRCH